jgi:hypothetical protein
LFGLRFSDYLHGISAHPTPKAGVRVGHPTEVLRYNFLIRLVFTLFYTGRTFLELQGRVERLY